MTRPCSAGAVLATIAAACVTAACSRASGARTSPTPASAESAASAADSAPFTALLARSGYAAVPMQRDGNYRLVAAALGTTPLTVRLDTGAPFDFLLDSAPEPGPRSRVHPTDVFSSYWTFTASKGPWAVTDTVSVGPLSFTMLETKVEPPPVPGARALLGATALADAGAIVDYATDSLYLPAHPTPPTSRPGSDKRPATLRAALERAGRYRTFLALMRQAGLMPLLEQPSGGSRADSVAWLGLRFRAEQLSGVGEMPPNDVHLQLTRQVVERRLGRPGRHTAFVPTDEAFAKLPADTLRALRADTARLARVLRAHLFPGVAIDTVAMRTLVRGVAGPGQQQAAFGFHVVGPRIDVDRLSDWNDGRVAARATIVEPDLRAANGIGHGIDRLLTPFTPSPLAAALARDEYVAVPLSRRQDGNGYAIHAAVDGLAVRLDIDTGAPGEIVLDRSAESHLPPAPAAGRVVTLDSVRLGTVDVTAGDFSAQRTAAQHLGYRASDGVVGAKLLAKYRVRIDLGAGVMYLPRSASR